MKGAGPFHEKGWNAWIQDVTREQRRLHEIHVALSYNRSQKTVLKMMVGSATPSPGLSATLSHSDGQRDGVSRFHAFRVFDILAALWSQPFSPVSIGSWFPSEKAWQLAFRRGPKSCHKFLQVSQSLTVETKGQQQAYMF